MDINEKRACELIRRLGFDFAAIDKTDIINLLEQELACPQQGSLEYIRLLCGYLYCVGSSSDAQLIRRAKHCGGMDRSFIIDSEWIESLENGGEQTAACGSRAAIIDSFVSYYKGYHKDNRPFAYRCADRKDIPIILHFIRELAAYEKMSDEVVATEELLEHWLFDKNRAEVIFALEDEKEVGFALFFHNFSTFLGRAGIYLEDLFVLPEYRGRGYGKGLLRTLAQFAIDMGCGRLEWSCLDWNKPSIDFYLSLGARPMADWTVYRLTGETLAALAEEDS